MRAILVAAALLGGCQFIPGTDAAKISRAHGAVAYDLADAGSAKFRNDRIIKVSGLELVCGEVNAKNAFGAYVGFKPYSFEVKAGRAVVAPDSVATEADAKAALAFALACNPAPQQP